MQQANGFFHRTQCGCHEGGKSDQFHLMFNSSINDCLTRNIFSEVDDRIAIVFQQNFYNVLADVMNIALDSCQYDFSLADRGLVTLLHGFLDDGERRLCCICC